MKCDRIIIDIFTRKDDRTQGTNSFEPIAPISQAGDLTFVRAFAPALDRRGERSYPLIFVPHP